jgi:hypothetical protein
MFQTIYLKGCFCKTLLTKTTPLYSTYGQGTFGSIFLTIYASLKARGNDSVKNSIASILGQASKRKRVHGTIDQLGFTAVFNSKTALKDLMGTGKILLTKQQHLLNLITMPVISTSSPFAFAHRSKSNAAQGLSHL